ncbi:alpha/beta hydrolase-fold protein [Bifidobacterium sp. ESL0784]|uniref:alpha/beta hydrolase n=1 Tax=Bifidobacterium sp. ESL0784 TaxID=2983231 RepID=UPI0023F90BC8|nr:alpha/beta hydrolase-fold protein [Bifidobacterium sp. ESL0784]MDF7641056.1 alpha/beta hydrolase-fold protein [Bifidobacterium sp. ESL0784]
MDWFYNINLLEGWLPTTLKALTLLGFIAVILLKSKDGWFSSLLKQFGWGFIGTIVGYIVVWLLSDVFLVFGVSLGRVIEFNIAFGIGFISVLVAMCFDSGTLRKVLAIITAFLTLITFALRVDIIYGEYSTVGSLFGRNQFAALESKNVHKASATRPNTVEEWKKLGEENKLPEMPKKGIVRSVDIPATTSNFKARTANVYLPPAALTKNPPKLPVMVVMAGQPGTPDRFFSAGLLGDKLDNYAAKHYGLAPIAVSPDQNGTITHNSLCSDTPVFGNAETYLTRDVTNWIKKTLPVETSADKWLIGGYSQGGTCATQLGAAYPNIYGHIYSAGGEIEPTDGSHNSTVKRFFNGNEKEFDKHVPINIIRSHAPSKQTWFSAAGQLDPKSQKNQKAISAEAMKAGMSVTTVVVKGTAHDWHTVNAGMTAQIDLFGTETGLGETGRQISSYPNLQVVTANTNRESD